MTNLQVQSTVRELISSWKDLRSEKTVRADSFYLNIVLLVLKNIGNAMQVLGTAFNSLFNILLEGKGKSNLRKPSYRKSIFVYQELLKVPLNVCGFNRTPKSNWFDRDAFCWSRTHILKK